MALVKKPPAMIERRIRMEEPVSRLLDDYCRFVDCTPGHVVNFAVRKVLAHDLDYKKWKAAQALTTTAGEVAPPPQAATE